VKDDATEAFVTAINERTKFRLTSDGPVWRVDQGERFLRVADLLVFQRMMQEHHTVHIPLRVAGFAKSAGKGLYIFARFLDGDLVVCLDPKEDLPESEVGGREVVVVRLMDMSPLFAGKARSSPSMAKKQRRLFNADEEGKGRDPGDGVVRPTP